MDDAERIRLDTIENMRYLKDAGFDEKYLKEIHHNGNETYKKFFGYWEGDIDKITSPLNWRFSERVQFIVDEHKATNKSFFIITCKALKEYPK